MFMFSLCNPKSQTLSPPCFGDYLQFLLPETPTGSAIQTSHFVGAQKGAPSQKSRHR